MNTYKMPSVWNTNVGPLNDFRREIDRLFDGLWGSLPSSESLQNAESEWTPACDIEENGDHYLISMDVPGVPKDQIKLEVLDNQLTVTGEKRRDHKNTSEGVRYVERRQGKFLRTFALPVGVSADKVEAHYQDGTLRLFVPKAESAKPRQIKITNGSAPGLFGRLIGQSSTRENDDKHSPSGFENDKAAS